jgi:carbohydrate-selective porin OprB
MVCSVRSSPAQTYCWPYKTVRIRVKYEVKLETYLDVVVDDLEQRSRDGRNAIDDFTKGGVAEGGRNTARVNRTHRIVRPVLRITFDSTLHVIPR